MCQVVSKPGEKLAKKRVDTMATNSVPTTDEALQFAVSSIKKSDYSRGRKALKWVLKREPENVAAWLWMERCVEDVSQKGECFRRASALNPMQAS